MAEVKKYTAEQIRDVSESVYRKKLDAECGAGTAKRTDDDIANGVLGPNGKPRISIRDRAASYDRITRIYIDVLGIKP